MSFIELLFIILCVSILIVAIDYALQDIKACEKEIEEYNKTKLDN